MTHPCLRVVVGVSLTLVLFGCGGGGSGGLMPDLSAPDSYAVPENQFVPHRLILAGATHEDTELFTLSTHMNRDRHGDAVQAIDRLHMEDLGPWAERDQIVTYATLPYDSWIIPAVTRQDGELRGFVIGPEPPASFADLIFTYNTYTYSGPLFGLDSQEQWVDGMADIEADFHSLAFDVNLRDLVYPSTGEAFLDGTLYYSAAIYNDGTFRSYGRQGDDGGRVEGSFFGADEGTEYVGGALYRSDLTAVFTGEQTSHTYAPPTVNPSP